MRSLRTSHRSMSRRAQRLRAAMAAALLASVLVPGLGLHGAVQAADCWVADAPGGLSGTPRAPLARGAALLRQDPFIEALPDVRLQGHRHADGPRHPGAPAAATASVWLHAASAWQGTCGLQPWADRVHPASLSLHLNTLESLGRHAGPEGGGLQAIVAPAVSGHVGGYTVYEQRLLVITPPGIPPFVPVTTGQWLDAWQQHLDAGAAASRAELQADLDEDWSAAMAELARHDPKAAAELRQTLADARRQAASDDPTGERAALRLLRAGLSEADLAAPAWVSAASMDRARFALARPDEPGAQALVQVNPDLWRGSGPQAVRVVALEVFLNRSEVFDTPLEPLHAAARNWLSQLDPRPYAALLTP